MGVLDKFEKGVERVVSNAFAKAFKSEVKPVELASALRREIDDRAAVVGRDRTVVPNEFVIELSPVDHAQVVEWGAEPLADELAANVTEHATGQRYAFRGPVTGAFVESEELETGRFLVRSATVRAAIRRGCVCPIWPSRPRPRSSRIFGSWVVFPDPVSPETITTWWSRMAAAISARRAETGSSSG